MRLKWYLPVEPFLSTNLAATALVEKSLDRN
jgi:hypothetical protein